MVQFRYLLLVAACSFTSCVTLKDQPIHDLSQAAKKRSLRHTVRSVPVNQAQGSAYINERAYDTLQPKAARVEINLTAQRATLYDGNIPVIETPISTGTAQHPTRVGRFKIMEKKRYKESNLYGRWVDRQTGRTVVHGADSRDPAPPGTIFKGTPVPLWQRVTSDGIGMHVGQLPGYAASHGCIRFPGSVMPLIYEKTLVGTPVSVISPGGTRTARKNRVAVEKPVEEAAPVAQAEKPTQLNLQTSVRLGSKPNGA